MQAMGGVKYMFLTHRDDVAEHAKWAKALSAERILHTKETNPEQGTECAFYLPIRTSCMCYCKR